jgi:hypothetical protein
MDWIKRHLYFVVGSAAAFLLMVVASLYLFSNWKLNNDNLEKLNAKYAELVRFSRLDPHPGSEKVDNVRAARADQERVQAAIVKVRRHFTPIAPIPDSPRVNSEEFAAALRRTIDQLQRDATNASVMLPPRYGFSFEAQRPLLRFVPGSLEPLSAQLGDIKAISDILFRAKVNSLDNIRRERISTDDNSGPQSDYLEQKSVTNDLAVLSPYEVTFQCFSPELAAVLAGFANVSSGIIIKSINVEPSPAATQMDMPGGMPAPVMYYAPPPTATPQPRFPQMAEEEAFARRYGLEGPAVPRFPQPPPRQPIYAPQPTLGTVSGRGGLPTVLNEKQLRVTLVVDVIKLLPRN